MIHAESTVQIARPVEAVFDFLADARNEPTWLPGARTVALQTPEPIGPGTRFAGEYAGAGAVALELVTFERPTRLTIRAIARIVRFDDAITLTPEDGGTRLRAVMDAQPRGPMRLLGPLMGRTMRRQFAANWLELKRFLEREPNSSPDA
jgi:uncharacterized protein YndB with AHSA1/START domain